MCGLSIEKNISVYDEWFICFLSSTDKRNWLGIVCCVVYPSHISMSCYAGYIGADLLKSYFYITHKIYICIVLILLLSILFMQSAKNIVIPSLSRSSRKLVQNL